MSIKLIADVVGSLFPVIFPKQQFKPKRAVGAVVAVIVVAVLTSWLGIDSTVQVLEVAEDFIELTEE